MEKLGLVAGSHNRNEVVITTRDPPLSIRRSSEQEVCGICGDKVGVTEEGEVFVACNECAFPICRTCYDYERKEGTQLCPRCNIRLKRLKGCARVEGDEEEDEVDDLENEFNQLLTSAEEEETQRLLLLHGHEEDEEEDSFPQLPLLTEGVDDDIRHPLVPSSIMEGGQPKRSTRSPFLNLGK